MVEDTQEKPVTTSEKIKDVNSPDYAITYYATPGKNYGAAAVWFSAGYNVLAWPLLWAISTFSVILMVNLRSLSLAIYTTVSILGAVAFILGIIGLFTYKKNGNRLWVTVMGVLLPLVTGFLLFFVFL